MTAPRDRAGEVAAFYASHQQQLFWLSPELDERPAGDPECTFVIYMCAYAGEVLRGELPGPYTDQNARTFAQAALIPDRLIRSPAHEVERVARVFGIPDDELTAAREDW